MMRSPRRPRFSSAVRTLPLAMALVAGGIPCGGCGASRPPLFEPDSAMVHVERQLGFGPRVPGSAARDAAARYLARTLESYGARVTLQSFDVADPYRPGKLRLINIIGNIAPDRSRRVMLAAHYDSRPWADQEPDTTLWRTPIPGAVDGAAGVAILLEVARLLGTSEPDGVGVDIVLFDGEDYGREGDIDNYLLGSKHFAANLAGYRPSCAILLDMVGGRGTRVRREGFSYQRAPALVDYIFGRASALGLSYFEPADGGPMIDDHVPLLQSGIDTIDLFAYGYAAWHTRGDDLDQCDPGLMGQVGTLLLDVIYDFRYRRP